MEYKSLASNLLTSSSLCLIEQKLRKQFQLREKTP